MRGVDGGRNEEAAMSDSLASPVRRHLSGDGEQCGMRDRCTMRVREYSNAGDAHYHTRIVKIRASLSTHLLRVTS